MGLIRTIFKIIKWIIRISILLAIILYPLIVLRVNPFIFYWEKLKLLWEIIKNFPFRDFIDSIKNIGSMK